MLIHVLGYPSSVGGANTELWHTLRLWRAGGIDVTLTPTGEVSQTWRERCDSLGCATTDELPPAGAIVASFCNRALFTRLPQLAGCRIVWAPCMNWLFPDERQYYRKGGQPFAAYLFQSQFQRDQLTPQLDQQGAAGRYRVIHGAFCCDEFPFAPLAHKLGEAFHLGRISRAEPDKWLQAHWSTLARVPHPLRFRALGWSDKIEAIVGRPPNYAECLPAGCREPGDFLAGLHCLWQLNQQAVENWPRVGLEAMARGVPIVTERRGGWLEMVEHERSALLADTPDEAAYYAARLAYDEQYRMGLIIEARNRVERLSEPQAIYKAWEDLFNGLG